MGNAGKGTGAGAGAGADADDGDIDSDNGAVIVVVDVELEESALKIAVATLEVNVSHHIVCQNCISLAYSNCRSAKNLSNVPSCAFLLVTSAGFDASADTETAPTAPAGGLRLLRLAGGDDTVGAIVGLFSVALASCAFEESLSELEVAEEAPLSFAELPPKAEARAFLNIC